MSHYLLLPSHGSKSAFLWQLEDREPLPAVKARLWNEFSMHLATCEICNPANIEPYGDEKGKEQISPF
jgi:hypothetical protein